jgi:hypothetical protein
MGFALFFCNVPSVPLRFTLGFMLVARLRGLNTGCCKTTLTANLIIRRFSSNAASARLKFVSHYTSPGGKCCKNAVKAARRTVISM